jgi:enoyl-CoA hydratase/carnithine racemase
MTETISLEIVEHIADIRLNRPEKRNAINLELMLSLITLAKQLKANKQLRAVVLSGNGEAFCAGMDFEIFTDMLSGEITGDNTGFEDLSEQGANKGQQMGWLWQEIPVPVIAAVHGAALGAGLNIALGADIRIVTPDAKLGLLEITWGFLPDTSATQSLRHLASLDRIKELIFTGRFFSGQEAYEYGLATELSVSPHERALEMATTIAGQNPDAIRRAKDMLNKLPLLSVAEGLALEAKHCQSLLGSPNQLEATAARFEKRAPRFSDPQYLS